MLATSAWITVTSSSSCCGWPSHTLVVSTIVTPESASRAVRRCSPLLATSSPWAQPAQSRSTAECRSTRPESSSARRRGAPVEQDLLRVGLLEVAAAQILFAQLVDACLHDRGRLAEQPAPLV